MLPLEVGYEGANMANNFSRPATMFMPVPVREHNIGVHAARFQRRHFRRLFLAYGAFVQLHVESGKQLLEDL
jgi:hypothetical protein